MMPTSETPPAPTAPLASGVWRRLDRFVRPAVVPVALSASICTILAIWLNHLVSVQTERNQIVKREIAKLDYEIAEVAKLKAEINLLSRRARESADRRVLIEWPLRLLSAVADAAVDGVVIDEVRETSTGFEVLGRAATYGRVDDAVDELIRSAVIDRVDVAALDMAQPAPAIELPLRFRLAAVVRESARPKYSTPLPALVKSGRRSRDPQ